MAVLADGRISSGRAGTTSIVDSPVRERVWVRVGMGGRNGWVDPRLAPPAKTSSDRDVRRFEVPLLIGTERVTDTVCDDRRGTAPECSAQFFRRGA